MIESSYAQNELGEILKAYVVGFMPVTLVELGVLHGYSAHYIARGIKELHEFQGMKCVLDAYDLFEDYPYKHGNKEEVENGLKEAGLSDYVRLYKGDAFQVQENYEDGKVEFLHVDISNTGETLERVMELWHPKMCVRGLIMFEGGSEERDQIEWMTKYNKKPIKPVVDTHPIIQRDYWYGTYWRFPSLTVLFRKC